MSIHLRERHLNMSQDAYDNGRDVLFLSCLFIKPSLSFSAPISSGAVLLVSLFLIGPTFSSALADSRPPEIFCVSFPVSLLDFKSVSLDIVCVSATSVLALDLLPLGVSAVSSFASDSLSLDIVCVSVTFVLTLDLLLLDSLRVSAVSLFELEP